MKYPHDANGKQSTTQSPYYSANEIHKFNRAMSFAIPPFLDCPGKATNGKTPLPSQQTTEKQTYQSTDKAMFAFVGLFGCFCKAFAYLCNTFNHFKQKCLDLGFCDLPDNTPNHTLPPNKILMRSLMVGFQQETHCLPSFHTGNDWHSLSDIVPGRCNTFVDCGKSIGFISFKLY